MIKNQDIYGKSREISIIGRDIMNFLRKNPQKISSSIYFLDYYLNTTRKILNNFIDFEVGNVSDEMYSQITNKTIESLDLLKIVYKNQRDSYYSDKLMEIDVENDVLEATIKLGGGKY